MQLPGSVLVFFHGMGGQRDNRQMISAGRSASRMAWSPQIRHFSICTSMSAASKDSVSRIAFSASTR